MSLREGAKHQKLKVVFHIYKAKDGYRWRAIASNGRLTAESGESYVQRVSCKRSLASLIDHISLNNFSIRKE